METLLNTVLSVALLSSTLATSAPATTQVAFTRVLPEKDYVGYVVEKDSSLAEAAIKAYGSDDHWTTVWNDNPIIADPDTVTAGTVLKIRIQKPTEPAKLSDVLSERDTALTHKKNEDYLKQIGYESTLQTQPTVAPTAAPSVQAVSSAYSDEAITYLGNCEAGNNPARNSGNGYYGAFQFSYGTWKSLNTGYERADLAPLEVQRAAVKQLLQRSSIYNQFPGCANKMRNEGII